MNAQALLVAQYADWALGAALKLAYPDCAEVIVKFDLTKSGPSSITSFKPKEKPNKTKEIK